MRVRTKRKVLQAPSGIYGTAWEALACLNLEECWADILYRDKGSKVGFFVFLVDIPVTTVCIHLLLTHLVPPCQA